MIKRMCWKPFAATSGEDVRIIPLDTNCFIRELKSGISFLIQGAMVGIHEDGRIGEDCTLF